MRDSESAEAREARKERERTKIAEYLSLSDDLIRRVGNRVVRSWFFKQTVDLQKKKRDWSEEALDLTSRMLRLNPEFYTIWNYRRNILIHGIFPNKYVLSLSFYFIHGDVWCVADHEKNKMRYLRTN